MFLLTAQKLERFAGLPHCAGSFPNTCLNVISIKTEEEPLVCFLLDYYFIDFSCCCDIVSCLNT